jgi:homoserine kinase
MTPLLGTAVRVPCSTSNLGSGFDTLGLALDRYVHATFEPGGSTLEVERTGTLVRLGAEGVENDLLVTTFTQVVANAAGTAPRGSLRIHSEIPVARGLGSSAAALVAGHDLGRGALGLPSDPRASFLHARKCEGHGDNAAPCALGGLRAVVPGARGPRALSLELSPDLGFAYAAPAMGLPTQDGRAALPRQVPHEVAVAQLGRLAALMRGLAVGDAELIRAGVEDQLHVPHRLPLIPGAFNAMGAGYDAGAWAVTISGSGSGLIAITGPDDADAVAEAMHLVFAAGADDPDCVGFSLSPDFEGVRRAE